jgi:hypothetical protein
MEKERQPLNKKGNRTEQQGAVVSTSTDAVMFSWVHLHDLQTIIKDRAISPTSDIVKLLL